MDSNWHQDDKSIQPRQLPQFEVAGPQIDGEYRALAVKMIVSRVGIAAMILLGVLIVTLIPTAMKGQRTEFAKIETGGVNPFAGRIQMRLLSVDRQDKIKGWIFSISAGETKADSTFPFAKQEGGRKRRKGEPMTFLICNISLTNNSNDRYTVNPYAFVLNTDGGISYKTDLATKSYGGRLGHGQLKPGKTESGALVFRILAADDPESLEIMGAAGPIARVSL